MNVTTTESLARPQVLTQRPTFRVAHLTIALGRRLLAINALLAFAFLYVPIVVLIVFSFNNSRLGATWQGFTTRWYLELLRDEQIQNALVSSLKVALSSTIIATVLGTMTALALERYRWRLRTTYDAILYLPIVIPDIVMAVSLLAFFSWAFSGLNGLLGTQWRPGLVTVIIAHVAFNISFVTVVIRASLKDFDRTLEEAAKDLGANEWTAFRRVTLPLILPGILAGALLAFTLSLDDFVITKFTTGPGGTTLPIQVYGMIRTAISPKINAISTLMLLGSIALVAISQVLQRRR